MLRNHKLSSTGDDDSGVGYPKATATPVGEYHVTWLATSRMVNPSSPNSCSAKPVASIIVRGSSSLGHRNLNDVGTPDRVGGPSPTSRSPLKRVEPVCSTTPSEAATSATVRFWSMTRAEASRRNSAGYLPRRRAGVGCSSVITGMTTSYSRCPANGGMLRASERAPERPQRREPGGRRTPLTPGRDHGHNGRFRHGNSPPAGNCNRVQGTWWVLQRIGGQTRKGTREAPGEGRRRE